MKKLFFFRSFANNNASHSGTNDDQTIDKSKNSFRSPRGSSRTRKQILEKSTSGTSPCLRRSLSFSSAALDEGVLMQKNSPSFINQNGPPCSTSNIPRKGSDRHSYRRALTPERHSRQCFETAVVQNAHVVDKPNSSSESSSYCSSNVSNKVVDRYIDGEQDHENHASTKNLSQRNEIGTRNCNGKRPPRIQYTGPASPTDSTKDKARSHSFMESKGTQLHFPSRDWVENEFGHESPRSLAKHVIERLSQSRVFPKQSVKEFDHEMPITIEDIYGGSLNRRPSLNADETYRGTTDFQKRNSFSHDNCVVSSLEAEEEIDAQLLKKSKEAEERFLLLSKEIEQEDYLEDRSFSIPELIHIIRNLNQERVAMAHEVSAVLNAEIAERASAREEENFWRAELNSQTRKLEKEKIELQSALEKELDRRSSDWSFKLEKYQREEHRLRDRVRELAEQNVSLQRDVSSFSEREVENRSKISSSDSEIKALSSRVEKMSEENQNLQKKLFNLEEKYRAAEEDLDCIKRNSGEKEKECKDLHRSITGLLRTCGEQEKTIDGLRKGIGQEIGKKGSLDNFDNQFGKLQMEQIRLTGVEQALRKEVESCRLDIDSLRRENICLLHRLKDCGKDGDFLNFKLDQELLSCVCYMQNQGISLVKESNQLCSKLLEYIKTKTDPDPEAKQGIEFIRNGLDGQFIVESDMKIQGFKRETESLTRYLHKISSVLNEKSNQVMDSHSHCSGDRPGQLIDQSSEDLVRSELKAEILLTSLLREKLYSKELEVEQLQAELAAAFRGNGMLRCEVQNAMDNISCMTHKMKDLELQVIKKDEKVNQFQNDLQECTTELTLARGILPKISEERDLMWEEVKQYSERNMLLNSEINVLKKRIEALDEDILLKEGQISILKDTIGKPFDLLASLDCM